jgi:hypothetical protein
VGDADAEQPESPDSDRQAGTAGPTGQGAQYIYIYIIYIYTRGFGDSRVGDAGLRGHAPEVVLEPDHVLQVQAVDVLMKTIMVHVGRSTSVTYRGYRWVCVYVCMRVGGGPIWRWMS